MSALARRFGGRLGGRIGDRLGERGVMGGAGFAARVIGVGLLAGLLLVVCQFLIDAWFRVIR